MNRIVFILRILKKGIQLNIKSLKKSIYDSRMFEGVEFRNPRNILFSKSSNSEKGSLFYVTNPISTTSKNIIIEDFCWIGRNVELQTWYDSEIKIGKYVSIQDRCKVLGSVSIGKYSILAPDIFMSSGNHQYKKEPFLTIREQDKKYGNSVEKFKNNNKPITIEEDCWIGKNVFIQQGVCIGKGSVIGTNSIVTKDTEPYTVSIGSPAKSIKNRIVFEPLSEISAFNLEHLPYFYRGFEYFIPNSSTIEFINLNHGILSENLSLVLMKKLKQNTIVIEGFGFSKGKLNVSIDGVFVNSIQIDESAKFNQEDMFDISISTIRLDSYYLLPELIKKHLCINFEFIPTNTIKNLNFSISKIKLK
jgi:acetyltransferase-like isoleucine patch superfamily enzyme